MLIIQFRPSYSPVNLTFPALYFDSELHYFLRNQSQSHIATDGQPVSLGVEPHLGLTTRYLLLFDSYDLVFVGRSL
jgi:hypothetical protein